MVFPLFLVAIKRPHIVEISLSNLFAVCPFVGSHRHLLDASAVVAVHTTKDAASSPCAGFLGRDTFLDEQAFAFHNTRCHLVFKLVVFGSSSHFHGFLQEEKTRSSQITQLSAGLHHHINARSSQFFGRDEADVVDASEGITERFYTEHIEGLRQSGTFCFDELRTPEGIAHFAWDAVVMATTIFLNCVAR